MERRTPTWTEGHQNGLHNTKFERRTPKWRPGHPNTVQDTQAERRTPKWNAGHTNGNQDTQIQLRTPKRSPGHSKERRAPKWSAGHPNGGQGTQMELRTSNGAQPQQDARTDRVAAKQHASELQTYKKARSKKTNKNNGSQRHGPEARTRNPRLPSIPFIQSFDCRNRQSIPWGVVYCRICESIASMCVCIKSQNCREATIPHGRPPRRRRGRIHSTRK